MWIPGWLVWCVALAVVAPLVWVVGIWFTSRAFRATKPTVVRLASEVRGMSPGEIAGHCVFWAAVVALLVR